MRLPDHGGRIRIRLPEMHPTQNEVFWWEEEHPEANVLVCPCGTKWGKSFVFSAWLLSKALANPGSYCCWLAPTYLKCRIGYRYIKAMLPDIPFFDPVDGRLEIRLANGSFIQFLHGRDAEVTVEGEAIDYFVGDETGKLSKQLWISLFTTITQTDGRGIWGGTPRGFTWYWDVFKKAQSGDPFFCWKQFKTADSPYIKPEAIERARRILPKTLFDQYYMAQFVSAGTVFGDLTEVWQDPDELNVKQGARLWLHPDQKARSKPVVHGVDWAKRRDYTVFFSVNSDGQLVGLYRFRGISYPMQVSRLERYCERFFGDQSIRYDATGVGDAVGDMLAERDLDADVEAVTFTNKLKQELVTRTTMAIETGYFSAPRITTLEHEFASYEVSVTRSGLHSYAAPEGEHDDIVSAGMLSLSGAYSSSMAEEAEKMLEGIYTGDDLSDDIDEYVDAMGDDVDIDRDLDELDDEDDIDELLTYEA